MLTMQLLLHQMKSRASILDTKGGAYGSDGLAFLLKSPRCSVRYLRFCVWILFYCHLKSRLLPTPAIDLVAACGKTFIRSCFKETPKESRASLT
jgi:hypothetical protein